MSPAGSTATRAQVAEQLMAHDALGAHARDELGISDTLSARPVQAALASAATFRVGAALPLLLVLPPLDLLDHRRDLRASSPRGRSLVRRPRRWGAGREGDGARGLLGALAMAATRRNRRVFGTMV